MEKENIMRESLSLFRKYGIRRTSMDVISEHLNVSKKTIYQHFKDKEDLLLYVISRTIREFEEELQRIAEAESNPLICVAKMYKFILTEIARYSNPYFYDIKKIPAADQLIKTFQDKLASVYFMPLLLEAQEKKIILDDADIRLVYNINFFHLDEIMSGVRIQNPHIGMSSLYRHIILYNLRGILSEKHRKLLDGLIAGKEK